MGSTSGTSGRQETQERTNQGCWDSVVTLLIKGIGEAFLRVNQKIDLISGAACSFCQYEGKAHLWMASPWKRGAKAILVLMVSG